MSREFTTDSVPGQRSIEYWTEYASDVFVALDCTVPPSQLFQGRLRQDPLASLAITELTCSAHAVQRTSRQIAKSADAYFLVALQCSGRSTVVQSGRTATMSPGDLCMYDSAVPYMLEFPVPFVQLILRAPRDLLRAGVSGAEWLTARTISSRLPAARLAADMMRALRGFTDNVAGMAADSLLDMIAASLLSLPQAPGDSRSAVEFQRQKVLRHIQENLSDPELSVGRIALALGMSEAHLYQLFRSEEKSLARTIWAARLDCCRTALRDPLQRHRSVSDIAYGWGFNDAAHFSRAFKERFGMSPREWRSSGAQDAPGSDG